MTTTTFTAPAVLVWFQLKHLRWAVAALAVGLVGSAFLHRSDLIHDLYGVGGMTPLVFFGFLAVLFAVLLFGMEYEAGAHEFIHTRPVSERTLFVGKIFLVTLFTFLCGTGAEIALGPSAPPCRTYLTAIYLDIAFVCAAVCILFRDAVRGILFGSVAFAAVAPVAYLLWMAMTKDAIEFRPGPPPIYTPSESSSLPSATLGVLLSPIILLGGLSMIARFRRFGSIRITPLGVLGGLVLIAYILTVKWIHAVDARTVLLTDPRESNPEILTAHQGEGFVVYVEVDRYVDQSDKLRLKRLDLTDPNALPETVAILPMHQTKYAPREAYLSRNRLFLFADYQHRIWKVFTLDDDFQPTPLRQFSFDAERQSGRILDASTVCIETISKLPPSLTDEGHPLTDSGHPRQFDDREYHLLNLESGEIEVRSSCAARRTDPSSRRFATPDWTDAGGFLRSRAISPPFHGPWIESTIKHWLVTVRGNPVHKRLESTQIAMTTGNWILVRFQGLNRIAVCELGENGAPRYLGIAAIPPNIRPRNNRFHQVDSPIFRRSDGAIGYLTHYGPMWFEFPALMKEAKRS